MRMNQHSWIQRYNRRAKVPHFACLIPFSSIQKQDFEHGILKKSHTTGALGSPPGTSEVQLVNSILRTRRKDSGIFQQRYVKRREIWHRPQIRNVKI